MEIGLAGELIVKCLDCGAEYRIDVDSLVEECFAYERNMGYEVEHDFCEECQCEDGGNAMRFTIKAFEYPVGALNYCDEESDGCEILESPETVVNYYDSDFDYYEIDRMDYSMFDFILWLKGEIRFKPIGFTLLESEIDC